MSLSIDQLRAAFKKNENEGSSRPNNYYPFWNMSEGSQATVRFLPDANDDNPMGFMVEKLMHSLMINGEEKKVPCLKMYGEECPICKVSAAYYKEDDKVNGKKYWRKKQHIAQVLVVEDPLPPNEDTNETHEGKVRFLNLGYQVFNIIKDTFETGELDEVPFAFEGGTNFLIKKTKQGEYSSYNLSKFARKSTDLDDDEIAAVKDQMIDLSTLLPPNPGLEKVEAMLEAALTGAEYNEDSSSKESTSPEESEKSQKSSKETSKSAPISNDDEHSDDDEYSDEADDILAQIRERQKKKNS